MSKIKLNHKHKLPNMHNDQVVLLNDFAIRSFRDTADLDYIAARMAYQAHLTPQSLWSAL